MSILVYVEAATRFRYGDNGVMLGHPMLMKPESVPKRVVADLVEKADGEWPEPIWSDLDDDGVYTAYKLSWELWTKANLDPTKRYSHVTKKTTHTRKLGMKS